MLNNHQPDSSISSHWHRWLYLFLALPVGILLGWLFISLHKRKRGFRHIPAEIELPSSARRHSVEETATVEPSTPPATDDLTIIKGFAVKIAAYLQANGIQTFQELANADPEELRLALMKNGFRMINPADWMVQAHLAATGEWEKLKEQQQATYQ